MFGETVVRPRPVSGVVMPGSLPTVRRGVRSQSQVVAQATMAFAAWFTIVVLIQVWTGAYRAECGRYSDDAAHFMNGMLVRDYVRTGLGQNPIAFAENYYLSYPKIAPLMWPPLFHGVLGLLLLVGAAPYETALLLVAATGALLIWRLHRIVLQIAGPIPAMLAAGLMLGTNLLASLTGAVMLDLAIAGLSLEAMFWLSRYAESGARRYALWFGVFAAAACLTKGNGLAVLLTPVFLMVLTGRYDLLRSQGLYIAAAVVILAAAPLLALNVKYEASIDSFGPVTLPLVIDRIAFYSGYVWRQLGPVLLSCAAAGTLISVVPRFRRLILSDLHGHTSQSAYLAVGLVSLLVSTTVFHLFVPLKVIGITRYAATAIPPLIALACLACWALIKAVTTPRSRAAAAALFAVLILGASAFSRAIPRPSLPLGYGDAIGYLNARGELSGARLLVISDEAGEGAFVTEAARLGLRVPPTMVRGSKLLATDDWAGNNFAFRYASSSELLEDLEAMHISYVVVDDAATTVRLAYFGLVQELAKSEPVRFAMDKTFASGPGGPARALTIYRVTSPSAGAAKPVEIHLTHTLGRSLVR